MNESPVAQENPSRVEFETAEARLKEAFRARRHEPLPVAGIGDPAGRRRYLKAASARGKNLLLSSRVRRRNTANGLVLATSLGILLFVVTTILLGILLFSSNWSLGGFHPGLLQDAIRIQIAGFIVTGIAAVVALVTTWRKQRTAENEWSVREFEVGAKQLGDGSPAVRLAGVHSLTRLASVDRSRRQMVVDILCSYLRLPYTPSEDPRLASLTIEKTIYPNRKAGMKEIRQHISLFGDGEVRRVILRTIRDNARDVGATSWSYCDFDFSGALIHDGVLAKGRFCGSRIKFDDCVFSGVKRLWFHEAEFVDAYLSFSRSTFRSLDVVLERSHFKGARLYFARTTFEGGNLNLSNCTFDGCTLSFERIEAMDAIVSIGGSVFRNCSIRWDDEYFDDPLRLERAPFIRWERGREPRQEEAPRRR